MNIIAVPFIMAVMPLLARSKVVYIPSDQAEATDGILRTLTSKIDDLIEEHFTERSLSMAYTSTRLTRNLEAFLGNETRFTVNDAYKFIMDQIGVISSDEVDRSGKSMSVELANGLLSLARINNQLDPASKNVGRSGGYGGEGGHDMGYIDPYVVLGALGFGTFLFNIIYNILNSSGRSVDVEDLDLPLELSDLPDSVSGILEDAHEKYGSKSHRHRATRLEDLYQFIEEAKEAYDHVADRPKCLRSFACRLVSGINIIESRNSGQMTDIALDILFSGLGRVFKDENVSSFVSELRNGVQKDNSEQCQEAIGVCKDPKNLM